MYPKKDNTLSLLGGAVLGAVAMYLLDPESGNRRRHDIAVAADDATSRTGETLAPALGARGRHAPRSFGATVAGGAAALGHGIHDKYEDVRDSRSVRNAGRYTSDAGSSVADAFRHAGHRARKAAAHASPANWFHKEEQSHAGAYAGIGVGTLVLGAAAMYLLDPERGQAAAAPRDGPGDERVQAAPAARPVRSARTCATARPAHAHEARELGVDSAARPSAPSSCSSASAPRWATSCQPRRRDPGHDRQPRPRHPARQACSPARPTSCWRP